MNGVGALVSVDATLGPAAQVAGGGRSARKRDDQHMDRFAEPRIADAVASAVPTSGCSR